VGSHALSLPKELPKDTHHASHRHSSSTLTTGKRAERLVVDANGLYLRLRKGKGGISRTWHVRRREADKLSVVTLGTDRWEKDRCQPIQEARLLAAVRKVLGQQVESLRMPPFQKSELVDPWSAEANIGVPVRPFPRWMRCVKCGLLSPFDAGLFELKANRFRPERTCFVHKGCTGSRGDQKPRDADA